MRVLDDGDGVEVVEEALFALFAGRLSEHEEEDWVEEAGIFFERGTIAGGEGGFDSVLRCRRDEFEPSDEDAGDIGGGFDGEWKNGINEGTRNDVDEARAFLEPGAFPGFEHGVGFVGEETLGDEEAFESCGEGIEGAVEGWQRQRGLIAERAKDAIAEFGAAPLKEDDVRDWVGGFVLELHGVVRGECGGEWGWEGGDATVEKELFALLDSRGGKLERRGRGLTGRVVRIFGMVGRKIRSGVRIDVNGVPGNGARRVLGVERKKTIVQSGIDGIGMGIPLGDDSTGEGDVDRNIGFARGIEIEDRSLHANGAGKAAFEFDVAKMLDEGRKICGAGESEPVHGLTVGAGDGSEGAPFMGGEVGGGRVLWLVIRNWKRVAFRG